MMPEDHGQKAPGLTVTLIVYALAFVGGFGLTCLFAAVVAS